MKQILRFLSLLVFFGCNNSQKQNLNFKPMNLEYKYSYYKNENDTIEFVRIVKDSSNIRQIKGTISFDSNYNTCQKITHIKNIQINEMENIESELLEKGFRNKFDNKKNLMFIQIRPKDENDLKVLDLRHKLETKIESRLSNNGIGEWVAGDLGPGGANMLFEVSDWDNSFQLVIELLNSEGLINNCLISKRLYTADDDWNYEVVYPTDYDGIFNQM